MAATATATRTASLTPTARATATYTPTRTATRTPTVTFTATFTFTATPTRTPTRTRTPTFTLAPSATATVTPTRTATPTPSMTPSEIGPRVSYLGIVNADGCAGCCEYSCYLTPTPTPMYDEAGRRVFLSASGMFLFVLEGAQGSSRRDPGTNLSAWGSNRGDVQVLFSRDLGDPGPRNLICDRGPPPEPVGGVPGIDPPDFRDGADVTGSIQDFECRLTVQESSQYACTRDATNFRYMNGNSRKQFCAQVSRSIRFAPGDTIVAARLRDTAGNLGPAKEIVVRVLP